MAKTKIGQLRHRVALCAMHDVVVDGSSIALAREAVCWTWALIEAQWHLPSFISRAGYAIKEMADRPTHYITIRAAVGLDITSTAWVYEERLKSPPRWYKVVGFAEDGSWLILTTHLQEHSDQAQRPVGDLTPQPSMVKL